MKDAPTLQSYTLSASDKVPALSDGIFREYRLAVFMSYNELHSPKFKGDVEKIKAFWRELEAFLNDIYVRDLGVRFTIIEDERLIEREYHGAYTYKPGRISSIKPSAKTPTMPVWCWTSMMAAASKGWPVWAVCSTLPGGPGS